MKTINLVVDEVSDVLNQISEDEFNTSANLIHQSKRVFVSGEGRSGLVGKCFAMRLMHLGYTVYVVGETITPSLQSEDTLVLISGTGNGGIIEALISKAEKNNVTVLAISSNKKGTLWNASHHRIHIPATTRDDHGSDRSSKQLLGSLFDQSVHLLLDALCLEVSYLNNTNNDVATHAHW